MVRKLFRTLVSLSLATPLSVWGLGLGDIHLYSALNEKLNARIDLLSVEEGDLRGMAVELASYDSFERVGIERTGALALLDFTVEEGSNGKPYVKVTSKQAVREPFLDFLIEVEWRYGKLLREYTLLLDPPEIAKSRAPATTAPAATPLTTTETVAVEEQRKPAGSVRKPAGSVKEKGTPPQRPPAGGNGSRVYGPIKANENLWSIAKRMRKSDDVSINQMMIALFRANPEAFLDQNINLVRKGAILRLDNPAMARELNEADAVREVARQTQIWRQRNQALAEQRNQAPAKQGTRGSQEPAPASSVATREEAKLKLVSPEGMASEAGGTSASGDADLEALQKELMLAQEAEEAQSRENDELRERLRELEGQLASMQRLLVLEGDDMARLQEQLANGDAEEKMSVDKAVEDPAVEPDSETALAAKVAEKTSAPKEEPKPQAKPKPKPKPVPASEPDPEPVWVGLLNDILDDILADPYTVGGVGIGIVLLGLLAIVIRRRMSGGGFQESILTGGTSSMLNPKGGDGDSSMETSLLSDLAGDGMGGMPAEDSEVDPITEADVYMAYGRHQQAEELLKDAIEQEPKRHDLLVKLLEIYYKTKNKNAFQAQADAAHAALGGSGPQWDKIAAMGHELAPDNALFAAAPESRASISEESTQNSGAGVDDVLDIGLDLDALAAEMEPSEEYGSGGNSSGASGGDPDFDLGVDLSELDDGLSNDWAGTGDTEAADEPEKASTGFDDLDFGVDLLEENHEEVPDSKAGGENADELGDLDFGFDSIKELPGDSGADEQDSAFEELDFGLESTGSESASEEAVVETGSEDNGLDFSLDDFNLPEEKNETLTDSDEVEHEEGAVMDFDLGDFKLPGEGEASESESVADEIPTVGAPGNPDDEAVLDFGFGLDDEESDSLNVSETESGADDGSDDFNFDLDEDFGDGLDEVGTKLDLATAYVEMGDAAGAQEMLDEVLKEGDAEQKQRAQQLLDQIAS